MDRPRHLVERLKYSPLGRWATLPLRVRSSAPPLLTQSIRTLSWIVTSREWANFSTRYSAMGLQALCASIAWAAALPPARVRAFAQELLDDESFARTVRERQASTRLRHITDPGVALGKCLANYVLTRTCQARQVFEAGTEQGLSSLAIARALRRNATEQSLEPAAFRLTTVDIQADRGLYLLDDEPFVQRIIGDSVAALQSERDPIDLFIHDTVNLPDHTLRQLDAAMARLAQGGFVHTSWFSAEFQQACEKAGFPYLPIFEDTEGHWFKGRRAGIARKPLEQD